MNNRLKILGSLLAPSPLSLVLNVCLVIILSSSTLIKYGVNTKSLYELVLGRGSAPDLINSTHLTFSLFYHNIFGNPLLNKLLFFLFWMLVGLVVYLFIMLVGQSVGSADETRHEMHYVHADKAHFLERHIKRLGVHLGVLVIICLYTILFIKAIMPYSLLSIQIGAATLPELSAFGYGILGILLLSISLHVYAVLLRLLLLRIRVFGAAND